MRGVVWQEFVCYVIVIIHPLVLEGESEKWRILHIIASSGSGVNTLQALYTISSSFGPLETVFNYTCKPRSLAVGFKYPRKP